MPSDVEAVELSRLLDPHPREAPCLVHEGRTWTYGELRAAVSSLAGEMAAEAAGAPTADTAGSTPGATTAEAAGGGGSRLAGEPVAFMLPNGPEAVCLHLACFRSGAIAAPLDTRYAPPELERALRRARPRWLVVDETRVDRVAAVDPAVLEGVRVLVAGRDTGPHEPFAPLLASRAEPPSRRPGPDDPALLLFTSGSAGIPKGVLHSHRSAAAMLTSTSEALGDVTAGDRTQVCDPLVHVSGFIETLTTLLAGGAVFLYDGFVPDAFVAGLLAHRPTLVCTHIDVLARLAHDPEATGEWFSSLRGAYTGGDTVPSALQRDFTALAGIPIGVGYGMTEAIWLTLHRGHTLEPDGCIGTPVDGAELRTDEETGEILVRGPMVMTGYWQDPELTRDSFTGGWFRTGDLGRRDAEGVWWFEGRLKDVIVRRTSKITPGEVESAIDDHPAVAEAAVVDAPDPEEGQVPVAFVVLRRGQKATEEGLTAFLRERLAAYKVPARIHFPDALPLTASGKIDHRSLRERVARSA
ncbi:class I adenylate-forming enzyme family protein [Streptomyces sp. JJ36]|uniref:class I adenylate-forming enzyme family protein n=1 Tax=Streptomyces sp. JJ36 TaxID=2736645 RepID=UPI001F447A7A|nr:class I adenylate-forming enzyme family protein [Streptomyces sp. JJ36]MCF6523624.1 acyl--CoA ligase [Streptomyces sp. JJ36]